MSKRLNPYKVMEELCNGGIPKGEMGVIMAHSGEPKTNYKLQKLLEYCEYQKKYYDNPGQYEDDEYYIKCQAKSDMLEDVISEIKSLVENKDA